jgi:hypothetical protein
MTFFFQIAFPKQHIWEGKVIAVFQCTSYHQGSNDWPRFVLAEDHLIIPDNELDSYQTNFRVFVFDSSEAVVERNNAKRVLKFERIEFEKVPSATKTRKAGGTPNWSKNRWDGKSPTELYKQITYMGGGITFLMQTGNDWTFTRLSDAPPQFEHYKEDQPRYNHYSLFYGPYLYFSGTISRQVEPPQVLVYALG